MGRVDHPQTNGKVEKFFDIFEKKVKFFNTVDEFMNRYNFIRPHGAFDIERLETPAVICYKRLPKKEIIDQSFFDMLERWGCNNLQIKQHRHDKGKIKIYVKLIIIGVNTMDDAKKHFDEGLRLYELGRYEEAIEEFDKAIELDPNDPDYHYYKGIALYELHKYEEAIEEFDKAIELDPNDPVYHYNKGLALGELHKYEEAIKEFDKAIELNPYNPGYHNGKGLALSELHRYQEAIEEYDKAIELDPNDPDYHYNKGLAQEKLNQHSKKL